MEREPRNWRKYWHSYTAHVAQGLVVGFALPTTVALVLSVRVAISSTRSLSMDGADDIGRGVQCSDWPSRDIADFMLGLWIGWLLRIAQRRWCRSLAPPRL